jgi:hypothetical protein
MDRHQIKSIGGQSMIIEKVDRGREAFGDYSLNGNELTVGGVTVDLAAEEDDQQVIISFGKCNGVIHRGLMPCCEYVAEVIIPPRKYQTVEVAGPSQGMTHSGTGEEEELPATHTERVPAPLDPDSVILRLWPAAAAGNNGGRGA